MKNFPTAHQTQEPRQIVHEDEVEASIQAKEIGKKIRRLRLSRSMGLVELGVQAGLSASFLSQLETGRVVPTVKHLARIAQAFDKDMAIFFHRAPEKDEPFRILREDERIHLKLGGKGTAEMITQNMSALIPDHRIVPCIADLAPSDQGVGFHPTIFQGLEFVFVMEGELEMTVGREIQTAHTNDAIWVDGHIQRIYRSANSSNAKAMIITFPEI
ncbi:helix-turn-helix domain-containing protein [Terriglobus tenax]|uniref:helix-turn-helix domain-containing protein n=1 Tax=Terriglobus tenax TaxID=1111115 RepID=UPI0021DFDC5F|nr:XRE family transcriptional regulator [Terriglobus tenax]